MIIRQIFIDAGEHIANLSGLIRIAREKKSLIFFYTHGDGEGMSLSYSSEEEAKEAFALVKKQLCTNPQLARIEQDSKDVPYKNDDPNITSHRYI